MTPQIDTLTLARLAGGKTPLDAAMADIEILMWWRGTIVDRRVHEPDAFPSAAWARTDDASMAGRIVADLLDAGWSPPNASAISKQLRLAADRMEAITDAELIAKYDGLPGKPSDWLASARVGIVESAADYRRRADELDADDA